MIHPSLWHWFRVSAFMIEVGSYRPGPDITGLFKYLEYKYFVSFSDYRWSSVPWHRPVDVVGYKRGVEGNTEPLSRHEEEDIEEYVQDVLREYQGVQAGALVDRVLVICLQLVECNNLNTFKIKHSVLDMRMVLTWNIAKKMRNASMMRAQM